MLKDLVNCKGQALVEIMLGNAPDGMTPADWYKSAKKHVQTTIEPSLVKHLKDLDMTAEVQLCSTLDELEKMEIDIFPENFIESVVDCIDTLPSFNDAQKGWMLAVFVSQFSEGAQHYVNQFLQIRAQEIADAALPVSKKKKLKAV